MKFTVIIFMLLGIQTYFCFGIEKKKNATEEMIRVKLNDSTIYGHDSVEAISANKTIEVPVEATDEEEESEEVEIEEKFISPASYITLEHIDFVMLRLGHIAKKTSSDITELRLLQKKEFEMNEVYRVGWEKAVRTFNNSKRGELIETYSKDSIVAKVPDEYHIALIAYSLQFPTPALYSDFNRKTRQVCSGNDIDKYHYKTYFKFLILAIETLGREEMRFRSKGRFLYRGVGSVFNLEVGQILAFQQFISTSTTLKVAENFTGNTLFEVQGMYDTAISIKDHSRYSDEEEVLFSPFQVYEVESKHEGLYYTRYVLIGHKYQSSTAPCSKNDSDRTPELIDSIKSIINRNKAIQPESFNSGANKWFIATTNMFVWETTLASFFLLKAFLP